MEEHRKAILDKAIADLNEHFDNVVLLVTLQEPDRNGQHSTKWSIRSRGNAFANVEVARYFIEIETRDRLSDKTDDTTT